MKKRLAVLIVILMLFSVLAGCKSEIIFTYSPGEEESHYYLQFAMEKNELNALNASAVNGVKQSDYHINGIGSYTGSWTVDNYLRVLLANFTNFKAETPYDSDGYTVYPYSFKVVNEPEEEDDGEEENAGTNIKKGFFFYTITVEQESPFETYRAEYFKTKDGAEVDGVNAVSVFNNGLTETAVLPLNDTDTVEEYKAAGWVQSGDTALFTRKLMPSFKEAFPAFGTPNVSAETNLSLSYYLQTGSRLFTPSGAVEMDKSGNKYYLFSSSLNETGDKIIFRYYRAHTPGWNLVAVLIGALTVGLLLLYCKFAPPKKPEPQPAQAYRPPAPPAPFGSEYEKPDSGNKARDPFEGY